MGKGRRWTEHVEKIVGINNKQCKKKKKEAQRETFFVVLKATKTQNKNVSWDI
jgi:hypothetical protein